MLDADRTADASLSRATQIKTALGLFGVAAPTSRLAKLISVKSESELIQSPLSLTILKYYQ
jgi:hypothetical protein